MLLLQIFSPFSNIQVILNMDLSLRLAQLNLGNHGKTATVVLVNTYGRFSHAPRS